MLQTEVLIGGGALVFLGILTFFAIKWSLERLGTSVISYYPFDVYYPTSGRWTTVLFLLILLLLGLVIFFFATLELNFISL